MSAEPHPDVDARPSVRFGTRRVPLPRNRGLRIVLGALLLLLGCLWFLPLAGLWMLPAALLVLSVDFPRVRRFRRRADLVFVRWARRVAGPAWLVAGLRRAGYRA